MTAALEENSVNFWMITDVKLSSFYLSSQFYGIIEKNKKHDRLEIGT